MDTIRQASFIRNEIAHGKSFGLTRVSAEPDGAQVSTDSGYFLVAPDYMTERHVPFAQPMNQADTLIVVRSRYRYLSQDIRLFSAKFSNLKRKIFDYMVSIKLTSERGIPDNVMAALLAEQAAAEEKRKKQKPAQ
jgi:hypothetical protein